MTNFEPKNNLQIRFSREKDCKRFIKELMFGDNPLEEYFAEKLEGKCVLLRFPSEEIKNFCLTHIKDSFRICRIGHIMNNKSIPYLKIIRP